MRPMRPSAGDMQYGSRATRQSSDQRRCIAAKLKRPVRLPQQANVIPSRIRPL